MPEQIKAAYPVLVIEKGVIALLIFTPLAFGSVQEWSAAVMEIVAFIILGAWLINMADEGKISMRNTPLLWLAGALAAVIALQLLPLPRAVLAQVSASADRIYRLTLPDDVSAWRTISLQPDATREELLKVLAYVSVFFVMINHYRTKEQIKSVVRTVLTMGCGIAIFAVIQKMTWNGSLYWLYPIDRSLEARTELIWGPYVNRNHFAGYMEMAAPLALGVMLYLSSTRRSSSQGNFFQRLARFAASSRFFPLVSSALLVLFLSAAVFMSLSRGGMLGLSLSLLFFIVMTRNRRLLKKGTAAIAMLGAVILGAVVIAGWSGIENRFAEMTRAGGAPRQQVWADAIGMVKDYPLFGTGLGTFKTAYPGYQTKHSGVLFEHAENDYIEALTDLGVAGCILLTGMMFAYLSGVIKQWEKRHDAFVLCISAGGLSSCVAIAAHSVTDFNMRVPANALLLTVIAALTYATVFNVLSERHGE